MTIKNLEKLCDKAWSERIRKRDKRCQICNKPNGILDPHHIFSRRHLATRWNLDNGILLCRGHHHEAHLLPIKFSTTKEFYCLSFDRTCGLFLLHKEILKPTREWLENKLKELKEGL